MNAAFVFLWMLFFHIVDDYYLQGWLASAKQKSWWKANAPDKLYEHDYIWALIMHSISWAFMVMLPIAYFHGFAIDKMYVVMFLINAAFHAVIDDQKANRKSINLWADQMFHMMQIVITFVMFN
jgi:hypothetical protein